MLNLMACLKVSVARHVIYFSVNSAPTNCFVFIIFTARCKILFQVNTPWKILCQRISTWYTGHNLNMGNSYIQYIASYFVQISYFLLYLLTDYRPEYSLYISSYVMLWPEWKIKLFFVVVVVVQPSRLHIHCLIPYIIHHMVIYIISKKLATMIRKYTL